MAAKDNRKKDSKDKLKSDIDDILKGIDSTFGVDSDSTQGNVIDDQINEMQRGESIDFDDLNPKFKKQAVDTIDAMYKFYLDIAVLDERSYLNKKRELHGITLSGMFFQLKTMKTVLERIAEELTAGNLLPRLIEVYSSLSDKYDKILKSLPNYIMFMEENIQDTALGPGKDPAKELPGGENVAITRGTQGRGYYLCSNQTDLEKATDEIEVEEVDKEEADHSLINPEDKGELLEKSGIDKKIIGEDDDLGDYESLMDVM